MKNFSFFHVAAGILTGSIIISGGAAYASEGAAVTTQAEIAPVVVQNVGTTDVYGKPGLWPKLVNYVPSDPVCGALGARWLAGISLKPKTRAQVGYDAGGWEDILTTDEIVIDPKFSQRGKILVVWTVRVLAYPVTYRLNDIDGNQPLPPKLRGKITSDPVVAALDADFRKESVLKIGGIINCWYRSVDQVFSGGRTYGKVYTRLVDAGEGNALGREIVMTLPDGGTTTAYDPTHSGSVLLTPSMFGGRFPGKIRFKVQWKNSSTMLVSSEANMRNIIVTISRQ